MKTMSNNRFVMVAIMVFNGITQNFGFLIAPKKGYYYKRGEELNNKKKKIISFSSPSEEETSLSLTTTSEEKTIIKDGRNNSTIFSSHHAVVVTHPTFESNPVDVVSEVLLEESSSSSSAEEAMASLAATILALLVGDQEAAMELIGDRKKELIREAFDSYDVCRSGRLSVDEARTMFVDLAKNIVTDIATPSDERKNPKTRQPLPSYRPTKTNEEKEGKGNNKIPGAARAHAKRVLANDEVGNTIERTATKLLLMADEDQDGKISLQELASLLDTIFNATTKSEKEDDNNTSTAQKKAKKSKNNSGGTFPQPLRAMAGSLQLIPAVEGTDPLEAASKTLEWNTGVPGDDHSLRRIVLEEGLLSIVGLGRSADASSYFLPELGIVLDAGMHVKSLQPKTVLLSHGHRDHIAALPTHANNNINNNNNQQQQQQKTKIFVPKEIAPMVRRFLLAEAQLNYGDPTQTDEETIKALGEYDIQSVSDGDSVLLPKKCYRGSSKPLGIEVFKAPHKDGIPAVSYGIYQVKTRLKPQYSTLTKSELGALLRRDNNTNNVTITESYQDGLLFYTGDTQISLLRNRWREILPKYRYVIHEATFLGKPSGELDESTMKKGHTHYSQLHPWICAFPDTTFVCVHWSLKYTKQDILTYFETEYGGVPKNVVLWV